MNENVMGKTTTKNQIVRIYYHFFLTFWRKKAFFRNQWRSNCSSMRCPGPKIQETGGGGGSRKAQESYGRWGKRSGGPGEQKRRCCHKEYNFEERKRCSKGIFRTFSFVTSSVISSH